MRGGRADEHAVAAGAVHLFHHQFRQVRQHILQIVGLAAHPGGHVFQDRLFTQVKADHLGHIGVHRFVIGHAGSHSVADAHVARAIGLHEARATQRGRAAKHLRIEKIIVHPPIDHIHPLQAARGPHVNKPVLDHQVLPFHQLHAHLLRKKGVLKIGAVVHAGRQHHHHRLCHGGRGAGPQGFQQHVGVMRHGGHRMRAEKLRKKPHHHLAVFQHVGNPRGHTQVVFQHVIHAVALRVGGPHDVDAGDVCIDVPGHLHASHLGAVLGVVQHQVGRNNARTQDVLPVVDVMDEAVERRHSLHQAALHLRPFMAGDDAGDQVERNQPLAARTAFVLGAIHRKRDAHAPKDHLGLGPAGLHHIHGLAREPLPIALVVLAHIAAIKGQHGVHLVEFLHQRASCNQDSKLRAHRLCCPTKNSARTNYGAMVCCQ